MKYIFPLLFIIAVALILIACKDKIAKKNEFKDNPYNDLRQLAFTMKAVDFELSDSFEAAKPYVVIMDWNMGTGISTLVCSINGDASIYLNSGGGIIGGVEHEKVNKAAKEFVTLSNDYIQQSKIVSSPILPGNSEIIFYFLTKNGTYSATEKIENFDNTTSHLLPLFIKGNDVITELRLVEGK